ncbi:MAG: diguanylate cyclase [Rhodocyclaceae bacterium]|nr:diguanylate cyclase [Rhodocyclaceae bacterium]
MAKIASSATTVTRHGAGVARHFGWLLIFAVLATSMGAISLAVSTAWDAKEHYRREAEGLTENTARALDTTISSSTKAIDLTLRAIKDELELRLAQGALGGTAVNALIERHHGRLSELEGIRVTDARGTVLWGTGVDPKAPATYGNRNFFSVLRDGPGDAMLITEPLLGKVSNKWVIAFVRRYDRPDGSFGGVISAALPVDHFAALLTKLRHGDRDTSLLRDSRTGGLIARHPPIPGPAGQIGNTGYSRELAEQLASGVREGTFFTPSGADKVARIVSFRRLAHAPFIVIAGVSTEDYFAEWRMETKRSAWLVAVFILVLLVLARLIWHAWDRQARHAADVSAANELLASRKAELHQLNVELERRVEERTAKMRLSASIVEHTSEGAMVTDERSTILSVNPAFVDITGYSAEEVVGKTPRILRSEHHDGEFYRQMWASLVNSGHWQGEVWNRRKNGEIYLEQLTINTVATDGGGTTRYVGVFSDITERHHRSERIRHLAFHDALTGLPNRMLFEERLQHALARGRREGTRLSVTFIDLDGFKAVNDALGHDVGDVLLQDVAKHLVSCLRRGLDTVARLGGDEFVILMEDLNANDDCTRIAAKIIAQISTPMELRGHTVRVGASAGIAFFPEAGDDAHVLMKHADAAMYEAKNAGKGCYRTFLAATQP